MYMHTVIVKIVENKPALYLLC